MDRISVSEGRALPRHPEQAAAIPIRVREGIVEVCLITTVRGQRWSVPKGVIDPGETAIATAVKEAWEEAGVSGAIEAPPLGRYVYRKWGMRLTVEVYLLRVTGVAKSWPEMAVRQRRWAGTAEAAGFLADHPVRELLRVALGRVDPALSS